MSDLAEQIGRYLQELVRGAANPITFDLLPQLDEPTRFALRRDKQARHAEVCRRAQVALEDWVAADV